MPRDDDLDYNGRRCSCSNGPAGGRRRRTSPPEWLRRLPIAQVFTAERAAYRNLVLARPPVTATERNPYREWIGRSSVSTHTPMPRRGIRCQPLGRCGGCIALARRQWHRSGDVGRGRHQSGPGPCGAGGVRSSSRADRPDGLAVARGARPRDRPAPRRRSADEAFAELRAATADYGWVHAIPNAAIIAASLLWGRATSADRSRWPSQPDTTPTRTVRRSDRQPARSLAYPACRPLGLIRSVTSSALRSRAREPRAFRSWRRAASACCGPSYSPGVLKSAPSAW